MLTRLVLIFLAGLVLDWLVTKYTRSVARGRRGTAVFLSGVITLVNMGLIVWVLRGDGGLYSVLAFAGGNSLGTFVAMR